MCRTPVTIWRDYATIEGEKSSVVPCGSCHICYQRRRNQWVFRLKEEAKVSRSVCFLTMTYEEEPLSFNQNGTLKRQDLTQFWKRLRYHFKGHNIKYYAVGEYGTKTLRPHYHAITFNLPIKKIQDSDILSDIWGNGHVHIGQGTDASFNYVCGYVMSGKWQPKQDDDDRVPQFSVMSKGLGKSYLTPETKRYHKENMIGYLTLPGGVIMGMPKYYKERIFSKSERKILAHEAYNLHNLTYEEWIQKDYQKEDNQIRQNRKIHEKRRVLQNAKL